MRRNSKKALNLAAAIEAVVVVAEAHEAVSVKPKTLLMIGASVASSNNDFL
jgi:hypothetical protein